VADEEAIVTNTTRHSNRTLFTMKFTPLLAVIGSAAAFAPVSQTKPATSSLSAWKDDAVIGILAPVGFFDPLGLSGSKSDDIMNYYRESELKHGRVAMAACLGWYLNAAGVHPAFNSELSNNPLEAAQQLPLVGWLQFVLGCGAIEWLAVKIKERPGYVAGDLLGASYWVDNSDEGWVDYQNKEIQNGRLAMLAFMGILTQDVLFNNYGDMIFKR
jgi:light-harvesting complex I chlorophyll a/b binding protein 4